MVVTLGEGNWVLGSSAVMKALALCTLCTVWNLLPNGKAIYLITFKTHISLVHNDFGESLFLKVSLSQYLLYKIDLFNFSKTIPIVVYCYYHEPHVIGTEAVYYFLLPSFS